MLREGEGSRAGAPTETRRGQLGLEVDLDLDLLGKEKKAAEERRG